MKKLGTFFVAVCWLFIVGESRSVAQSWTHNYILDASFPNGNYVENWNFEENADDWSPYFSAVLGVNTDPEFSRLGRKSLRIENSSAAQSINGAMFNYYEGEPAHENLMGGFVRLTAWVRLESGQTGKTITVGIENNGSTESIVNDDWIQVTHQISFLQGTPTDNRIRCFVGLANNETGTFYLDAVLLEKLDPELSEQEQMFGEPLMNIVYYDGLARETQNQTWTGSDFEPGPLNEKADLVVMSQKYYDDIGRLKAVTKPIEISMQRVPPPVTVVSDFVNTFNNSVNGPEEVEFWTVHSGSAAWVQGYAGEDCMYLPSSNWEISRDYTSLNPQVPGFEEYSLTVRVWNLSGWLTLEVASPGVVVEETRVIAGSGSWVEVIYDLVVFDELDLSNITEVRLKSNKFMYIDEIRRDYEEIQAASQSDYGQPLFNLISAGALTSTVDGDVDPGGLLFQKTSDLRPYQAFTYYPDPLNRIQAQKPFGEVFQHSNRVTIFQYGVDASTNRIVEKTIDEDGNINSKLADYWGRTIRTTTQMGSVPSNSDLVTVITHDELDRITHTTTPLFDEPGQEKDDSKYTYNTLSHMITKESRDAGIVEFVYSIGGQLRFQQDEVHRAGYSMLGQNYYWSFFKYDEIGRVIRRGEYELNPDRGALEASIDGAVQYGQQSFPTGDILNTEYNFYDDYDFSAAPVNNLVIPGTYSLTNAATRLTKSMVMDPNTGDFYEEALVYDDYGRVRARLVYFPELGETKEFRYHYDNAGRLLKSAYQPSDPLESFFQWFEYDRLGRLSGVFSGNVDDKTSGKQEARYYYDNATGKTTRLELGLKEGGGAAQGVDYEYTIRDWLKKINDQNLTGETGPGVASDKFGMVLTYHENEHGSRLDGTFPYFNGNIRSNISKVAGEGLVGYNYQYDSANRLLHGNYKSYSGSWVLDNLYSEKSFLYDKNGNILNLTRHFNNGSGNVLDFTYLYDQANGHVAAGDIPNRLDQVDFGDGTVSHFNYDGNGNMISDDLKGTFDFDHANQVIKTTLVSGTILEYAYDMGGKRYQKLIRDGSGDLQSGSKLYVTDIGGRVAAEYSYDGTWKLDHFNIFGVDLIGKAFSAVDLTYENTILEGTQTIQATGSITIDPESEIRDEVTLEIGSFGSLARFYYLKDHLGSIRVTVDSNGDLDSWWEYYPFGKIAIESGNAAADERFVSKPVDRETDLIYFGARYYDHGIGRWTAIDPLAEDYPGVSVYQYGLNDPVNNYDPNGGYVVEKGGRTVSRTSPHDAVFREGAGALPIPFVGETFALLSAGVKAYNNDPSDEFSSLDVILPLMSLGSRTKNGAVTRAFGSGLGVAMTQTTSIDFTALMIDKATFKIAEFLELGTLIPGSTGEKFDVHDYVLEGQTGDKAKNLVQKKFDSIRNVFERRMGDLTIFSEMGAEIFQGNLKLLLQDKQTTRSHVGLDENGRLSE